MYMSWSFEKIGKFTTSSMFFFWSTKPLGKNKKAKSLVDLNSNLDFDISNNIKYKVKNLENNAVYIKKA